MNNNRTPRGNRLHIAIFGQTNVGKSTLINTLCDQDVAITSQVPGTTTDPVRHAIELGALGPCVLIDTAGCGDASILGAERETRTHRILSETDIAIWLTRHNDPLLNNDRSYITPPLLQKLKDQNVPILHILNTGGFSLKNNTSDPPSVATDLVPKARSETAQSTLLILDVSDPSSRTTIINAIGKILPQAKRKSLERGLLEGWVKPGQTVCLIMPQDKGAPHGRLILPQSQTIQELLQRRAIAVCTTPETFPQACQSDPLPDLVICDSSVLKEIYKTQPDGVPLTTFSILFAAQKGDIHHFAEGADPWHYYNLRKILIAEACSHAPSEEDIGRVKIPALLRKRVSDELNFDICSGSDLPSDLEKYDLFIQCGACMRNSAFVKDRIRRTKALNIPMTNYGVAIAWLTGILDLVALEPPKI